jgi:hypothetical protein
VELDSGRGKQKEHQLISKATLIGTTREKIVAESDEAFALLLYENYIEDKWKTQGKIEDDEDEQYEDCAEEDEKKEEDEESVHSGSRRKKTITKALRGKYTGHFNGTTKLVGGVIRAWRALMSSTYGSPLKELAASSPARVRIMFYQAQTVITL